jgi:tRNA-dihydrouridine synthase B
VPVTVKMRLGWDENALNAPELARRAEQAGVAWSRCTAARAASSTRARRLACDRAREAGVSIPVVANGDVQTPADAQPMLAVGRRRRHDRPRALWAPWRQAIAAAARETLRMRRETPPNSPTTSSRTTRTCCPLRRRASGVRHARKHLGWYLDRHAPAKRRRCAGRS